jgi:FkbM family methyltransferase
VGASLSSRIAGAAGWLALRALNRAGSPPPVEPVKVVELGGTRVAVPLADGLGLQHTAIPDAHLLPVLRAALELRPGAFVDVGAHLGQTLVKVIVLGHRGAYVGFEPKAGAAAYVERLLTANERRGEVIAAAAGDRAGVAELALDHELDDSATIIADLHPHGSGGERRVVPLVRGDDVLARAGMEPVGVLKVDAEGAELEVLRGFEATIERDRPAILCEILPIGDEGSADGKARRERADAIVALVRGHDYRMLLVQPGGAPRAVEGVAPGLEFAHRDYVCVPGPELERYTELVGRAAAGEGGGEAAPPGCPPPD